MVRKLIPIVKAEDLMTDEEEQEVIRKMDEEREQKRRNK